MSAIAPIGDRGQRYEVRYRDIHGNSQVAGWTEAENGHPFIKMIELHPTRHSPTIIDRQSEGFGNS